jgi:hypothetical protein
MKRRTRPGWCHPIGAEVISAAFADVPQYAELLLLFCDPSGENALGIRFDRNRRAWTIYVYAVPSTIRAALAASLREEGLARAAQWLKTPRTDTWYYTRHDFVVGYDANGALDYLER